MYTFELFMQKLEEIKMEIERLEEKEKKYDELIYAVGNKYPNESRHETALKYIKEREQKINVGLEKKDK